MVTIINTDRSDLQEIFALFEHSIHYQERNGYPVWRNYDKNAIIKDVDNKNQYKVVINDKTAMVFSVCYSDKILWGDLDDGNSIYLHRIVVNPEFKGQRLFGTALNWAIRHSKQKGAAHIRMDTWADNPSIIDYYKSFGFAFVRNYTTPDTEELPVHNRRLALALLEYERL